MPTVRFKDDNIEEMPSKPKSPPDTSTPTASVKGILSPRGLVTENITKEEKLGFRAQRTPRKRHLSDRVLNTEALRNEFNIEEKDTPILPNLEVISSQNLSDSDND